jgi:hypothetical protein
MVRGKLQPALKYVANQPYINKYKVGENQQEVLTYPTINGDVSVNRKHNAYVDALSGKKGWGDGLYKQQHQSKIEYYYNEEQDSILDDPRTVADLEKENIDLKEQMIH